MRQFVREFLSNNIEGWTRDDLRTILLARLRYRLMLERSPKYFAHMIWDMLKRGDIEEREGKLFASPETRLRIEALRQRRQRT